MNESQPANFKTLLRVVLLKQRSYISLKLCLYDYETSCINSAAFGLIVSLSYRSFSVLISALLTSFQWHLDSCVFTSYFPVNVSMTIGVPASPRSLLVNHFDSGSSEGCFIHSFIHSLQNIMKTAAEEFGKIRNHFYHTYFHTGQYYSVSSGTLLSEMRFSF